MKKRMFRFDNPADMIKLAQEIQTQVYWKNSYYEEGVDEGEEKNLYKHFWDHVDSLYENNLVAVEISEDYEYVNFIYK